MKQYLSSIVAITGLLSANVYAQTSPQAALTKCASIEQDDARLACFDRLVHSEHAQSAPPAHKPAAPAPAPTQSKDTTAQPMNSEMPEPPTASTHKSRPVTEFGMEAQRQREQAVDEISATITHVAKDPRGKYIITLDNDMVWKQQDTDYFRPKKGDLATVERGALGVFYFAVESSNRRIKVKRLK